MNKAYAVVGVLVLVAFGGWLSNRNSVDVTVPSDEPVNERILFVAQGKFLERDAFGNIRFVADGADDNVVFSFDDFDVVNSSERLEAGSALALSRGLVEHDGEEVIQNLIGITNESFPYVFDYDVAEGRFFANEETENSVVVGQSLKAELQEKGVENVIGEELNVRGNTFTIVGVLAPINTGNEAADADLNKLLLTPRQHEKKIVGELATPFVEEMRFIANTSQELDGTAEEVRELMLSTRGQEDFTVLTPTELAALGINVTHTD